MASTARLPRALRDVPQIVYEPAQRARGAKKAEPHKVKSVRLRLERGPRGERLILPEDWPTRFYAGQEPLIAMTGARHEYGFKTLVCERHVTRTATRNGCGKLMPFPIEKTKLLIHRYLRQLTRLQLEASYPSVLADFYEEGYWLPSLIW